MNDEVWGFVFGDAKLVSRLLELRRVVVAVDDGDADVDAGGQRRMTVVRAGDDHPARRLHLVVDPSSRRQLVLAAGRELTQRERRRRREVFQPTRNLQSL